MITLMLSLLSFLAPFLPTVLKTWYHRRDQQHELALLQLQLAYAEKNQSQELQSLHQQQVWQYQQQQLSNLLLDRQSARRPIKTGYPKVDVFSALLRPSITALLVLLFITIKMVGLWHGVTYGYHTEQLLTLLWDHETSYLFTSIISFWFGERVRVKTTRL